MKLPPGPLLVHSDISKALGLVKAAPNAFAILEAHRAYITRLAGARALYYPTFNYDFTQTGHFTPATDTSQVGALSEHMRKASPWRSAVPVFSIAGEEPLDVQESGEIDPFGSTSAFAKLGGIVFYGASFASFTGIHHIERMAGGVPYRYDKRFPGIVKQGNKRRQVTLLYHVRPEGREIAYAFDELWASLTHAGIAWEKGPIKVLDFPRARDLLLKRLSRNPYTLLKGTP